MIEDLRRQGYRGYSLAELGFVNSVSIPSSRKLIIDYSTRKLATAILLQALKDAFVVGAKLPESEQKGWRKDALDWFFSSNSQPGSFNWVSEVMQTDAESFRGLIRAYVKGDKNQRDQIRSKLKKARLLRPT